MDRSDWLLLLISRDALGVEGPDSLDPVRIQKGMFLLSQRGPARGLYDFRPYNWGPFSRDVYNDLDRLVGLGIAVSEHVPGQSWCRYSLSERGEQRAAEVAVGSDKQSLRWMAELRRFLTARSFGQLLEDVYREFPQYATRSRFASKA